MFDLLKMILMNPVIRIGLLIGILYTIGVETGLISQEYREAKSPYVKVNR